MAAEKLDTFPDHILDLLLLRSEEVGSGKMKVLQATLPGSGKANAIQPETRVLKAWGIHMISVLVYGTPENEWLSFWFSFKPIPNRQKPRMRISCCRCQPFTLGTRLNVEVGQLHLPWLIESNLIAPACLPCWLLSACIRKLCHLQRGETVTGVSNRGGAHKNVGLLWVSL